MFLKDSFYGDIFSAPEEILISRFHVYFDTKYRCAWHRMEKIIRTREE